MKLDSRLVPPTPNSLVHLAVHILLEIESRTARPGSSLKSLLLSFAPRPTTRLPNALPLTFTVVFMVNPGAFRGSRKEFLTSQKPAYAEAVVGGYVADILADIQRKYFKRYPVDLPHDEEPPPEHLAAVDDDSAEPEQEEPDQGTMSAEDYAIAVKALEQRQSLIRFRKGQIKRWMAYQYMKDQDVDQADLSSNSSYTYLVNQISGKDAGRPRKKTAVNVWRKDQRHNIEAKVKNLAELQGIPKERWAALRDKIAREMFSQLPAEIQERWKKQAEEESKLAAEEYDRSLKSDPSTRPEDRQLCIQAIVRTTQPLLDALTKTTGWNFTLLGGGPEPAHGGKLNIISVHSGLTPGDVKMNFGRSERADYKKQIVPIFGRFLKKCFSPEECRSRALAEQGLVALREDELESSGATLDVFEDSEMPEGQGPPPGPSSREPSAQPSAATSPGSSVSTSSPATTAPDNPSKKSTPSARRSKRNKQPPAAPPPLPASSPGNTNSTSLSATAAPPKMDTSPSVQHVPSALVSSEPSSVEAPATTPYLGAASPTAEQDPLDATCAPPLAEILMVIAPLPRQTSLPTTQRPVDGSVGATPSRQSPPHPDSRHPSPPLSPRASPPASPPPSNHLSIDASVGATPTQLPGLPDFHHLSPPPSPRASPPASPRLSTFETSAEIRPEANPPVSEVPPSALVPTCRSSSPCLTSLSGQCPPTPSSMYPTPPSELLSTIATRSSTKRRLSCPSPSDIPISKRSRASGEPSFNSHQASSSTMPKTVVSGPGAPRWFADALLMLQMDDLGSTWSDLLQTWMEFETRAGFKEHGKLGTQHRPSCVGDWIQRKRSPTWRPAVEVADIRKKFKKWWISLQPAWRKSEGKIIRSAVQGDWAPLQKPGLNGLYSVVVALYFWGLAARMDSAERDQWVKGVEDVQRVLRSMVTSEGFFGG